MKYTGATQDKVLEKKREYIRVIPQFTIKANLISLIAEENHTPFKKGDLVKQTSRIHVHKMQKPYRCEIHTIKNKNKQIRYIVHPVWEISEEDKTK